MKTNHFAVQSISDNEHQVGNVIINGEIKYKEFGVNMANHGEFDKQLRGNGFKREKIQTGRERDLSQKSGTINTLRYLERI